MANSNTYQVIHPITHQHNVFPTPITALAFDPVSDILWSGSQHGTVTAYYSPRGLRGVVYPVGGNLPVKRIVAHDTSVRALGSAGTGVGTWAKTGMNKWFYSTSASITDFSVPSGSSSNIALATTQPELITINASTGVAVRRTQTSYQINQLQFSHTLLLSGSQDGFLRTHDLRTSGRGRSEDTGPAEAAVKAHVNGIQNIQSSGNFVYTIGWGLRQGRPFPDPLVKVYDLRTLRPLAPAPFSAGPAFINVHPKKASSVIVASAQGLINIMDVANPSSSNEFYQLDTTSGFLSSSAVSPSAAYLAFGDSDGVVHLLSIADQDPEAHLPFNGFDGRPVEWADTPETLPTMQWTDRTPLSSIGLPFYETQLLSSWTPQFLPPRVTYPPQPKIPTQVLQRMRTNENVAYAPLPKELRGKRNVVATVSRPSHAHFLSDRSHTPNHGGDAEPDAPGEANPEDVPKAYRKTEIVYSKFGVEDFDFDFYNGTTYSGLETHISNSYTNALVQTLHYCLPIRRLAKSHINTDCPREHCFLCEFGFVTRMLEDAKGKNCQTSNFCKTVGQLAQVSNNMSLVDYGRDDTDYANMIQGFHRFLIDCMSSEANTFPNNPRIVPTSASLSSSTIDPAPAPMTQLLGLDAKNIITCTSCKAVREKENMTHIIDLTYPRRVLQGEASNMHSLSSVLRHSLMREISHKATCQTCKQFSTFESRRAIQSRSLPPIMAINACVYNEDALRFWVDGKEKFLQPMVKISGHVDGMDDPETVSYELRGFVVQVITKEKSSHLVAVVKVPESDRDPKAASPWYIFNDFVVRNVPEAEALSFPGRWKVPTIIYLERVDVRDSLDFSELPGRLDPIILTKDTSISVHRDDAHIRHEPLNPDELPRPGTLISIDAEFVLMQQEEIEYRSDGSKKVLRPARMSLARVSVLRGDGAKEGIPFVDEHIHTSEVIVDYLTEFSGIQFGDLDPHMSPHTLTPLKLAYKRLRLLVDLGCIFVGHGLSKDFRIINLFVPPEQVIDTVDLYFIPERQRRLSLKFLSWFILKQNIQTGNHDSIEDARSALMLYKAYLDGDHDLFQEKLEEVYRAGREYNWKPPQADGTTSTASSSSTPRTQTPGAANSMPQYGILPGNLLQASLAQSAGTSTPIQRPPMHDRQNSGGLSGGGRRAYPNHNSSPVQNPMLAQLVAQQVAQQYQQQQQFGGVRGNTGSYPGAGGRHQGHRWRGSRG